MTGLKDLGISTGGTGLGDLGLKPKPRDTTGTSLADLGLTAARDTDAFAFHSPERTPFLQSDYASPQMRGLIKRGMEEPGTATMRDPAEAAIDDVIAQQVNKGLLADTMGALQRIPGNVAAGYQQYQSSQDLSAAIDLYENIDKIEDAGTEFSAPTRLNDRAVLRDPNLVASVNRADLSPAQRERVKAEPESVDQILVQGLSQRAQSLVESANAMRKKANAAEQAPETQALAKADSFADGWDIFWQNPVGIIADIGSQSATQSVMIAVGGAIGGGATGGPVGAGIGSALSAVKTVYASSIVDAMRRSGVDITDPKAIRAASKDDGLMAKVKRDAAAYTAVISAGAGLAGGIAGVNLAPKGISNAFAKEAVDLFGQMTAQAGIGAGSEAGALGASGQKITAGPLIMEAVGEAATAPIEVAGIAATARKNGKATKPKKSLKRGNRSMPAADSALQKMGNREYDAITDAEVNALLAAGYVQENPDSYVKLHGTGLEITKQGAARFRGLMTEQPGQPDAAQQGTSLQPEQDDGQRTGMQPQRGQRVQRADEVSGDAAQAAQQRGAEQRPEPSAGQGAQGADEITQPAPPSGGADSQGAQITRQQFYADPDNAGIDHEQVVAEALARGERVAPEVMWNYQDLAEQYPGIEPAQSVTPEPAETLPPQESVTARPVDQYEAAGLPVYEQTLADLSVSQDAPQFKDGADDEGVVEPLAGETYDRVDTGAVQVWERLDGRREVISGRHRRHKGLESGETTIPAQLHREADGFTAEDAAILDASLNIRDGQGTVKDYANFFKNANITEEAAESKGLLGRKKGRDGFIIGRRGSDETIASLNAGQITAEAAARISEAAPNNEAQQALGMATVQAGKPITEAVNTMLAVQSMQHQGTVKQGDLYGFDASAIERARDMGRVASRKQRAIKEQISAVRGAAKNPKAAKKLGVDVKNPEAVRAKITALEQQARVWESWHTSPALVAEIEAELTQGAEQPANDRQAEALAERQVEEAGQSDVSESTDSEPLLSSYSADDLTQREREQNQAQSEQDEQRRQAEQRAEADRNVDAFSLTGSDAEAEQAMAAGQDSLFEAPNAYNGARGDQDARNPRNLQRPDAAAAQSVDVDAAAAVQVEEQGDQLDLFIPQDSPIAGDAARFATQTMSVQVGTLPVGTKTVRNEADAAHVVAALRKNPQEKMYAIVTDKDGRVLTVIQHSMGTPKSASVSVGLLAGHVRDVPQAANVWFTHNHPSGQSRQSKADLRITRELNNVFDGSGIATHGMIVVAPGGAPSFQVDGLQDSQPIEQAPRARRQSVPVSEARFKRIGSLNKMPVSSPQDAIAIIRDMPDTAGVYLLDNKHRPVGFLPMTPEQMERLRTGDKNQGSGQFLHAIAQTNASALMVRVPDAASVRSAQNVEMFANAAGLRYLDTFYKNDSGLMVSAQGAGFMSPSSSTAFFSRAGQTEEPQNLYVAHNLTEENIKAADKLGGLAAPSLAVGNIDAGAIDNFGEITLLASPDILDSPKVKTFDADVYSPRQPRPQFDVNTRAWNDLIAELKASYPGNEMVADIDAVEREGAEGLWRSDALKYQYLQSVGKAPALKRQKVEPEIRRAAKDGADIKKIAEQYYRRSLRQVEQAMPEEATSTRNSWFGEDGKLTIPAFDKFRNKVMDYRRMGGYDLFELGRSLDKKLRNQATARGYGEHVEQVADRVIEGAKLFRGFTNAGNRRYSPYTMDNVLREMTRELQGGENWNYGAGSVRAKKAKQFRSRAAIQKSRDRIVSTEEMQRISDESQDRLTHLLTELQSLYRFEGGSFGYMDDASSAIADGPAAMREAFDMTPEAWTQAREFTGYLSGLPTAYFEAKAQRRVGLDEFDTAVVPRGADPAVVQRLKDDGLTIRYYKRGDAADRARAVRGARRGLFFSRGNAPMRRDPAESAREINQGLKDSLSKVRKHVPVTVSTANPADIYGAQAAGVEGVYDNGEVTLFAGNLSSPERAREILRHEAVGHFSMERMLGDGFQGTIDRVRRMHNNKRIAPLVEQVRIRYPRLDTKSDTFQQELIAVMAEGGVDMPIMRRMLAAMRRFLRSLGLDKGGISEMELRALLARAGRDLAAGGRVPRVRLAPTFSASSPTFYSGMAQVMAEKLPKQAPAAQMRQAIEAFARKGQIKAEELEWSGIIPWLDAQDGKVTKAELLEAFAGLTVRTEESIKSGRSEPAGGVTQFGGGGTRYGEYTLPGGESYTELLIQLPSSAAAFDPSKVEIKRNRQSTTQGTAELLYEGERLGGPYADEGTPQTNYMTPDAQWIETARRIFERGEYSPGRRTRTDNRQGNYIGSHFDEPNILAHLRMNLRNDGQTLFIEEIQSDWHQAGRKNDYTTQSQDEIRTRIVEIDNRLAQIRNEPAEQVGREEQALFAERGRLQELVTGAVPDAPFKKTWPLLALKRAIRYASDNGVTEIAWTTGAQQAKRYWGRELDSPAVRRWNAISEPQSVRKELFDYFGSELASVAPLEIVDAPMLAALNNNQVRRAVVKSIPVNVVNILSDNGFTPDQLVSEPNMVGEALAIDSRSSVARGLAGALQLVGARLRTALNRVLSSESTPRDQELFATIRASDLNPSVVMRLLSTLGSTNSRARLSSSGLGSTASGTESPGVTPSTKVDLATVGGELSPAELAEFLNRHALIIADSTGKPITDLLVQPPPGAGMRGFYDETLPRMANKYIKKWGSRVAITRIGTTPQSDERAAQFRRTTADIVDEYQAGRMPLDELNALTGSSLTTAELAGRSQDDIVTAIAGNEQHSTEVHGFPITPQMREAALAGQPLFSRPTTMDSAGEQAGARAEPDAAADPAADAEQSAYKRINQRPARGDMRLIARDADGQSVAAAAVKNGEWLIVSTNTDLLGYGIKRAKTRKQAEAIMSQGGRSVSFEAPGKASAEQADMGSSRIDLPEGGYVKNAALTFQYRAQDKFNSLKRIQSAAERQHGELADNLNPYMLESIHSGRTQARTEAFEENQLEPLLTGLQQSGIGMKPAREYMSGLSQAVMERFGDMPVAELYLYARHAPEANAELEAINPGEHALSGMSDAHAAQIIEALKASDGAQGFQDLARRIDEITAGTRQILVDGGLESRSTVEQWGRKYPGYVPLKGAADKAGPDGTGMPKRGRGFDIRGPESRRRLGRVTPASDILANVVAAHQAAITRAEKNRVGQAMLRFAQTHPDERLWTIDQPQRKRRLDPVTDTVQVYYDPKPQVADNVFVVKVGGVEHHVDFNESSVDAMRMAKSMKNLSAAETNLLVRAGLRMNRFLSMMSTSLNPEFVITNFARDLQTVAVNLNDSEAHDLKYKILKDAANGKAYRAIRRYHKGDHSGELAQYYHDFIMDGAETGWTQGYASMEDLSKDLTKKIANMQPGAWPFAKRATRNLFDLIGDMNSAVENGIRLSTYMQARKAGVSRDKAAALAKGISVNFNRRGDWGNGLNAAYLFYNAATQGTARIAQAAARSKKARRIMYGAVALGVVMDLANRWVAGDDEDGRNRYDQIPEYVKRMNWIIMLPPNESTWDWVPDWALGPNGDYIKFPMPYGYNMLSYTGQKIGRAMSAAMGDIPNYSVAEEALGFGIGTMSAFNPVGYASSWLQIGMPTIADPFVQWAENKNWAGIPIHPEADPYGPPPPNYTLYYSGARTWSKWVTEQLNMATGGTAVTPGTINLSPELLDHFTDFAMGGAGRFLLDTADLPFAIKGAVEGTEELEAYTIPFVGKIYGTPRDGASRDLFYDRRTELTYLKNEFEAARKNGDRARIRALRQNRTGQAKLLPLMEHTDKRVRALRKQHDAVEASAMAEAQKRKQMDAIEKAIEAKYHRFNRRYAESVYE